MARPFLSLVITVSHAAETLPLELIEADRVFSEAEFSYEIIVVDDGSDDGTSDIAKKLGAALKNVKVIDNTGRRGIGTAAVIGMLSARGNWRVLIKEPLRMPWPLLCEELSRLRSDVERDVLVFRRNPLFLIRLLEGVEGALLRLVFRSHILDFHPAALCFSGETATHIFQKVMTKRDAAIFESLLLAERMKYRVLRKVLPGIRYVSIRPKRYLQTLYETSKIRWWLWRKKYHI